MQLKSLLFVSILAVSTTIASAQSSNLTMANNQQVAGAKEQGYTIKYNNTITGPSKKFTLPTQQDATYVFMVIAESSAEDISIKVTDANGRSRTDNGIGTVSTGNKTYGFEFEATSSSVTFDITIDGIDSDDKSYFILAKK